MKNCRAECSFSEGLAALKMNHIGGTDFIKNTSNKNKQSIKMSKKY